MEGFKKTSFTPEQIKTIRGNVAGGVPDPERERRMDATAELRKSLGRRPTAAEVAALLARERIILPPPPFLD